MIGGGGGRPSDSAAASSASKPDDKKGSFSLGLGGKKDDDKKGDKPSGGGSPLSGLTKNLGGLSLGGKKDGDKKGDKPSGGGNPLGGLASRLPFGKKDDDKKGDKPSGGGMLGGLGIKKDDASSGSAARPSAIGGSSPSPFASRPQSPPPGGQTPPADKPAQPKSAKASGGGLFSRFSLPFGKKSDKQGRQRASKPVKVERGGLSLDQRLDILGITMILSSLGLLLSSLSPVQGALPGEINGFFSYLFGWGAIAVPISTLVIGGWLFLRHFGDEAPTLQIPRLIGIIILFLALLTIFQYVEALNYRIEPNADYLLALRTVFLPLSYNAGQGGGLIGAELYFWLISSIGEIGGFVMLFIPIIVGLMLTLSLSAAELALIIVSNVRNLRDGARQRAVRAAAERAKREEALAAARAAALAQKQAQISAPAMEALPPAGAKPLLPGAAESPVPVQMPLTPQEQRAIPITQGGRTVTATIGSGEPAPAPFNRPPLSPPAAESKPQDGKGGLGRILPAASAGSMIGSAVKALTPTEEDEESALDAKPEKRGLGLGGLTQRLPFGRKETTTPGAQPTAPSASPASAQAAPAQTPPPPAIPPVSVRPPSLTPAAPPASPPTPAAAVPERTSAEPSAPRLGDILRTPAAPAAAPSGAKPSPEQPAPRAGEPGAAPLTPRPSGLTSGFSPRPQTPPPAPPPLPTLEDEDDAEEESEDWKVLPPARPRGDLPVTPKPAETPFAPRVMGAKAETSAVTGAAQSAESKSGETPSGAAAQPGGKPLGWQDRMAALSGRLPGGDAPAADDKESSARPEAGRRPGMSSPFDRSSERREPPRIVRMDDANNEIDDEDELEDDLPLSEASSMKPISSAPARPAAPASPPPPAAEGRSSLGQASFPPPVRNPSPAFGKPDTPATSMPLPSTLRPSAPAPAPASEERRAMPAASTETSTPRPMPAAPPPPAAAPVITPMSPPAAPAPSAEAAPRPRGRKEWRMPDPATLLKTGSDQELDHAMLLQRAKTIEETLDAFGAPGRVVEVRTGPVITQFGVEPDYLNARGGKKSRVKVSAIAQLDKDLQLALGAKSIRIEAPVPGKGYVGIEVPNDQAAIVQLRDVLESEQFKRIKSPLGIALGQGVDGTPVAADLTGMPHLLIAGTTGSGKSVCVNSIIASLLLNNTPERLKFIMVDPKRVELTAYNGIPHLVAPVVVELERIVGVLKWVTREMDDRYRRFSGAGARNIEDYNKHLPQGETLMPYIVVIIDELADLMMLAPDETERVITRLAALARATGIHLVIATQRPSVDVVTGLIKANFPARIAFAVAGSVDSRVILDQPGAERLLGRGDMLYMSGDSPAPQRLQGVFVSDSEINNITRYWRTQMDDADLANQGRLTLTDFKLDEMTARDASDRRGSSQAAGIGMGGQRPGGQSSFWEGPTSYVSSSRNDDDMVDEDGDGEDDMYEEAVALVRQLRKASVSLLQRRLRIGYTRAAKLIDVMEDRGIVGPSQSGSTPRDVIG